MNEYKKPSGVPWRFWGALLILAVLVFVTYHLFPPSFEHSFPRLAIHGKTATVEFYATNHARTLVSKKVSVTVGTLRTGIKGSGPDYIPLDRREISVSLAPSETKQVKCEFPVSELVIPNAAEVTIP